MMRIRGDEVTATTILNLERASIRAWVESCSEHLTGRVLDYGSGQQPYRGIVETAGGEYVPHDLTSYPSSVATEDVNPLTHEYLLGCDDDGNPYDADVDFDAVVCTQVLQYVPVYTPHPEFGVPLLDMLGDFRSALRERSGWLVITGGTCWREIEPADHSRLTVSGARTLLEQAGFRVERCESRAAIDFPGFSLSLGWGALTQA